MKKEYRVQMDGFIQVWASDVDDALEQARSQIGMYLFAEEAGETLPDDEKEKQ